jgi:hypothetical protein
VGHGDCETEHDRGLGEHHETDAEHLAGQELRRSDGSEQHLDHVCGLLLHHPDQRPGVVLGEHHEQENQRDDRRGTGRGREAGRLEAVDGERPRAGECRGLRRRQSRGSHGRARADRP